MGASSSNLQRASRTVGWHRLVAALGAFVALYSPPALATRIPILTHSCDAGSFGAVSPSGLTYNTVLQRIVVVDLVLNTLFVVDRDCAVDFTFPLSRLGISAPTGVAFVPASSRYAFVDNTARTLVFSNFVGGLVGSCSLGAVGIQDPEDVTFDSMQNRFAIVDDAIDDVVFVGDGELGGGPCELLGQVDLGAQGITKPSGITYLADTNGFAVSDTVEREVFILDASLAAIDRLDIGPLAGFLPTAVTYVLERQRYYVVDGSTRKLSEIDARAESEVLCATSAFGATGPDDLAYNTNSAELLVLSETPNAVSAVDLVGCALRRRYDLDALGIQGTGLTYLPTLNQMVVINRQGGSVEELVFLDYASGAVVRRCDLEALEFGVPTALAWLGDFGWLAVADSSVQRLGTVALDCQVVYERSVVPVTNSLNGPSGIEFAATGRWIVTNWQEPPPFDVPLVSIVNFDATTSEAIDTRVVSIEAPSGIVALPGGFDYILSDHDQSTLYRWHLPAAADADSVSGRYRAALANTSVALLDRGRGYVRGVVHIGDVTLPAYGDFDPATFGIVLGVDFPNGRRLFKGMVSPDFSTILLPPPLGKLERSLE